MNDLPGYDVDEVVGEVWAWTCFPATSAADRAELQVVSAARGKA